MRTILLIFAAILIAHSAGAEPELKGSPGELTDYLTTIPKTVVITAAAEIKTQSDKAIVTLRVRTENKSLQEALRLNQSLRFKVLEFLKQQGILADRIQAAKFSSTPKYSSFSEKVKSYTVENSLKITVRDEKEFQAVAEVVDKYSEISYEGVEFEHTNKEEFKLQALRQAAEKVSAKKRIFEETLGVKLIPKRFSENAEVERQSRRLLERQKMVLEEESARKASTTVAPSGSFSSESGETIGDFGELNFKAQVTIEYSLEPK